MSVTTIRTSITKAMSLVEHVYLPRGAAVVIEGAPGASKTSRGVALARKLQAESAHFGGCYYNASNSSAVQWFGWPTPSSGLLSTNAIPELFQPAPQVGLRGAFYALAPADLVHPKTAKLLLPLPSEVAHSSQLTHAMLKPYPTGLVIVDEYSKASGEDVMASQSMLAYEGRTGQWGVPNEGWCKLFFGNRQKDRSGDLPTPATFDNRVVHMEVHNTMADAWPYWERIGMHPDFIAFAAANTARVLSDEVPISRQQYGTMRSFTEAWEDMMHYCQHVLNIPHKTDEAGDPINWVRYYPDFLPVVAPSETDPDLIEWSTDFFNLMAWRCGPAIAGDFVDFIAHSKGRPSYTDIVDDPANASIPSHPGVLNATIEMLIHETDVTADIDEVCAYLNRPDMPATLVGVFCSRMLAKLPFELVKHRSFYNLMNKHGITGRMGLDAA